MQIRIEPSSPTDGWHLDAVGIVNQASGYSGTFTYGNWLNAQR
jgi:hypothetical protein